MAAIVLTTPQTVNAQENQGTISEGGRRFYFGTINLPTSYNTGGYIIDGLFGIAVNEIESVISGVWISGGHPLVFRTVVTNGLVSGLIVYDLSTGAEAVSTFNVGAAPAPVLIAGS